MASTEADDALQGRTCKHVSDVAWRGIAHDMNELDSEELTIIIDSYSANRSSCSTPLFTFNACIFGGY